MGGRVSSAGQRQQETVKKSVIPGIPGQPVSQETLFSAQPTHTQQVKDGGQEGGAPGWKEGPVASAFYQQV